MRGSSASDGSPKYMSAGTPPLTSKCCRKPGAAKILVEERDKWNCTVRVRGEARGKHREVNLRNLGISLSLCRL
jgi:hypothetical protein